MPDSWATSSGRRSWRPVTTSCLAWGATSSCSNASASTAKARDVCTYGPTPCAQKQQPIVLRLVVARDGEHPVYLVTSDLAWSLSPTGDSSSCMVPGGASKFSWQLQTDIGRHKLRQRDATECADRAGLVASGTVGRFSVCQAPAIHSGRRLPRTAWPVCFTSASCDSRAWPGDRIMSVAARIDPYHRREKASRAYPAENRRPATLHHESSKPAQHKSASPPNEKEASATACLSSSATLRKTLLGELALAPCESPSLVLNSL